MNEQQIKTIEKEIKKNIDHLPWLKNVDLRTHILKYCGYSREFRGKRHIILKRDNYKCQYCNSIKKLIIHHADFLKGNNSLDNLISLCSKCHGYIHRKEIYLKPKQRRITQ